MNRKLAASCIIAVTAAAFVLPVTGYAADLKSAEASSEAYAKDSAITTKVKAELAAQKLASLVKIKVETDHKGVVTLSGTASTKADAAKAVSIARAVSGVTSVVNHLKVAADN